jgi:hypothetical protein
MCWTPFTHTKGHVIAQAVSLRLPTSAAWVSALVRSCGICGGRSGSAAGFLPVRRFCLPMFIPPIAPQSPSSIIWGWDNRPVVATVPSWLCLAPLRIIKIPPGRFLVLITVRGWVNPRAIVWLEGLAKMKNPVTSLGLAMGWTTEGSEFKSQ